jgi:tripartite-type tricarboxylate transporter receptor subunit TctC
MKLYRCRFTLTCLLSLLIAGGAARAQIDYPNKPVQIISDSAPGSAVDVGLRIIADGLSQHWNQQVLVVNQPGAGGAPFPQWRRPKRRPTAIRFMRRRSRSS